MNRIFFRPKSQNQATWQRSGFSIYFYYLTSNEYFSNLINGNIPFMHADNAMLLESNSVFSSKPLNC